MNVPESQDLDLDIVRARLLLSLVAMLSLYVDPDPNSGGGLFHLTGDALTVMLCHLAYAFAVYLALALAPDRRITRAYLPVLTISCDLLFATAISLVTKGNPGISFVFFVFAILAASTGSSSCSISSVTLPGVALYLLAIVLSRGMNGTYLIIAVYLAITAYTIGFFGKQLSRLYVRTHELEMLAARQSIARSLHDGYVQALAGVNLRLETCRELLSRNLPQDALSEITELQTSVTREYDEVRTYLRSLAGIDQPVIRELRARSSDMSFELRAAFSGRGLLGEHILQMMLEGMRNARTRGMANSVKIDVHEETDQISISIEDDGIGLSNSSSHPWAIASRVAELEGHLSMHCDGRTHLNIQLPNL